MFKTSKAFGKGKKGAPKKIPKEAWSQYADDYLGEHTFRQVELSIMQEKDSFGFYSCAEGGVLQLGNGSSSNEDNVATVRPQHKSIGNGVKTTLTLLPDATLECTINTH